MKNNNKKPAGKSRNPVRKASTASNRKFLLITVVIVIIAAVGIISIAMNLGDANHSSNNTTETLPQEISTAPSQSESTITETSSTKFEITDTSSDESENTSEPTTIKETTVTETNVGTSQTPTTSSKENPDGVVKYNGFSDPRTIDAQPAHDLDQYTALVNKFYILSADFEPELTAVPGTPYFLQPSILDPWLKMQADCSAATGVEVYLTSGYRSYAVQVYTFNDAINRKGIALTVPYNALAGRSEHQLGLAVDVNDGVYKKYSTSFSQTATYAWLNQHAHEYGFILRYPKGKEHITDYAYEPWHYRYVGPEAAAEIHSRNIVLEEYHGL